MNWIPQKIAIRGALLELLIKEKKEEITVQCGLKALDQIMQMPEYIRSLKSLYIADCYIKAERDFEVDSPWDIVYNGKVIFG
jgi:hypothetical protein